MAEVRVSGIVDSDDRLSPYILPLPFVSAGQATFSIVIATLVRLLSGVLSTVLSQPPERVAFF